MRPAYAFLGLLLLVAGCTRESPVALSLSAGSSNPHVVAAARDILANRFKEFSPSLFSSVSSNIDGSSITFNFYNGAPSQSVLEYLCTTPGRLIVSSRSDTGDVKVWYTDDDIENAAVRRSGGKEFVVVNLTEDAGKRVSRISRRSIGEAVVVTLDGTQILRAVVHGALGRSSEFSAPDPDRALALAVILKYGHLPTRIVEQHKGIQ